MKKTIIICGNCRNTFTVDARPDSNEDTALVRNTPCPICGQRTLDVVPGITADEFEKAFERNDS